MQKLDESVLNEVLETLPEWYYDATRACILRAFEFADFKAAWGFMSQVALMAEQRNHHPEWSNVYQRVQLAWTTHDAGGVSMHDVEAARFCDALALRCGGHTAALGLEVGQ